MEVLELWDYPMSAEEAARLVDKAIAKRSRPRGFGLAPRLVFASSYWPYAPSSQRRTPRQRSPLRIGQRREVRSFRVDDDDFAVGLGTGAHARAPDALPNYYAVVLIFP